ncbi:S-Ena type endospore appendage [Bacillus infantis]|uniref:S-Ena type endospore appendage n=1 Tax=Bacillus infantis TaxID=324767 RepID=UPI00209F1FF8|nr:S-Ena type endospore appendage [Bacillus infantis]MCP1158828.1 hypothetical protein [Bacillus infantis]
MSDSKWYKEVCCPALPPKGCPSVYPPHPPSSIREWETVTAEICGNISQPCDGSFVQYWRTVGMNGFPSATVSVINKSDCVMTVRADTNGDGIPNVTLFQISDRNQTKSVTIGNITMLEVRCTGGTAPSSLCTGNYCITLHYEREITCPYNSLY